MAAKRRIMDVIRKRYGLCGEIARKIGSTRQNVRSWRRVPEKHIPAVHEITGLPEDAMRAELAVERDWGITLADLVGTAHKS